MILKKIFGTLFVFGFFACGGGGGGSGGSSVSENNLKGTYETELYAGRNNCSLSQQDYINELHAIDDCGGSLGVLCYRFGNTGSIEGEISGPTFFADGGPVDFGGRTWNVSVEMDGDPNDWEFVGLSLRYTTTDGKCTLEWTGTAEKLS